MEREELYRLGIFLTLFGLLAIWEIITPRRKRVGSKPVRWFSNFTLVGMNTLLVPVIVPIVALTMAGLAGERGWGLLNNYELSYPVSVVLSVIVLDFVIYLQHIMFHAVPILWRLHRVHHSDVDLDVTSGTRFHLIEIVISMMIKVCAVALLGAPVLAVLIFEVLLNGTAMFNHANIRLPIAADRVLRLFVVTPDMHRIHHSVIKEELNTNFGFNLPWWDHLCGTYRAQPVQGHEGMTIGVDRFRSPRDQYPDRLLVQPFFAGSPEIEVREDGEADGSVSVAGAQDR